MTDDAPIEDVETLVPIDEDEPICGPIVARPRQDRPHEPRAQRHFRRLLKSLRRSRAFPWPAGKGAEQ